MKVFEYRGYEVWKLGGLFVILDADDKRVTHRMTKTGARLIIDSLFPEEETLSDAKETSGILGVSNE